MRSLSRGQRRVTGGQQALVGLVGLLCTTYLGLR